jgi:hypothetical protein
VTELLVRSHRHLSIVVLVPAVGLTAAFIVLAQSGGGFAIALTATASFALLVRARQRGFTNELVLTGLAGLVGLFIALHALMSRYGIGSTAAAAILVLCGLAIVSTGTAFALMRKPAAPVNLMDPMGGHAAPPNQHRFIDVIGVLCHIACVSLALGVFGVYSDLVGMGRAMVG